MADQSQAITDFLDRRRQQASSAAALGLDTSPEDAADAFDLEQSTGAPSLVTSPEIQEYRKQAMAASASAFLAAHPHLQEYANSHPMAPSVSQRDWANLDDVHKELAKLYPDVAIAQGQYGMIKGLGHIVGADQSAGEAASKAFKEGFDKESIPREFWELYNYVDTPLWRSGITLLSPLIGAGQVGEKAFTGAIYGASAYISNMVDQLGLTDVETPYKLPVVGQLHLGTKQQLLRDTQQMLQVGLAGMASFGVHPEMAAQIERAAVAAKIAKVYVDAGEVPPRGLHPILDEMHDVQMQIERQNLLDAQAAALKSETRELSPELFEQSLPKRLDHVMIEINAEQAAKFADKLDWVPDLQQQLAAQIPVGGDISIPVKQWLAKFDPEVEKELRDHIRVRQSSFTKDEQAQDVPSPPQPALTGEPLQDLRQIYGLDPKPVGPELKLVRTPTEPAAPEGPKYHAFQIVDKEGNEAGSATLFESQDGKTLDVDFIAGKDGQPLGVKGLRQLFTQIRQEFPNAETIEGVRSTGARGAEQEKVSIPIPGKPEIPETVPMEDREVFEKANAIGMTVDRYKRYMKLIDERNAEDIRAREARIKREETKRQTTEWQENRKVMREEVAQHLKTKPDILALHFLDYGELYGDRLPRPPVLDLSRATDEQRAILRDFGSAAAARHPGSYNPDDLAPLFGYSTGDQLVNRVAELVRQRKEEGLKPGQFFDLLVDQETERRMTDKYGFLPENILRDVKDRLFSKTQLDILHEDILHLAEKSGQQLPIARDALKAQVDDAINGMVVGGLRSSRILDRVRRVGLQIEDLMMKEKWGDAFKLAQQRYILMEQAKAAHEYEKSRAAFDRQAKTLSKVTLPNMDQTFLNFIHDIYMRVGKPVRRSIEHLHADIAAKGFADMRAFVEAFENTHPELGNELPVADFLLNPDFSKHIDSMTLWEFNGLKQSVEVLAHAGREEKQAYLEGKAVDKAVVKKMMIDQLKTFSDKGHPTKVPGVIRQYWSSLTSWETMWNRFDRDNARGINNMTMVRPMVEAANYEFQLGRDTSKDYKALGKIEDPDRLVESPFVNPLNEKEPTDQFPAFARKHALAVLQNYGNPENWQKLTQGRKADPEVLKAKLFEWTEKGILTEKDWDRAKALGEIFDKLKPLWEAVYRRTRGVAPESIRIGTIDTPFGRREGWYHPLIYDPLQMGEKLTTAEMDRFDNGLIMGPANGYTKRRTGYVGPLSLNFDEVPARLAQVIHDIAFREALQNVGKFAYDTDVRDQINRRYGHEYAGKGGQIDAFLTSIAGRRGFHSMDAAVAARLSEFMRQNVIGTYIGINPFTVMKHGPTAWVNSMYEAGPRAFAEAMAQVSGSVAGKVAWQVADTSTLGMSNYVRDAVMDMFGRSGAVSQSTWEWALSKSPELQRRERHWQETIRGAHGLVEGKSSIRERIIEWGSRPVALSDMISALPTWIAVYRKAEAEGLPEGQRVFEADRAVRRAHGSTALTNQPNIVRGGGALHSWLTSLYGFWGTQMQRRIEIAHKMNDFYHFVGDGEFEKARVTATGIATSVFTHVIFPTLIEEWVSGMTTDDRRGWGEHLAMGLFGGVANSFIYVKDIISGLITGHDPQTGLLTSPLHDVTNLAKDVLRGRESLNRQHAGKTVQDTLTVLGEARGLVPKVAANAIRFQMDLANRQQIPHTFGDYWTGYTRGQIKKPVRRSVLPK
jgi:hypothetical protein